MAGATLGDKIKYLYVIKDESGKTLEEVTEKKPEEIVLGDGDTIPGIEVSLVGMSPNEKKTVTLVPSMHFGPLAEELKFDLEKEIIPDDVDLEEGGALEYTFDDGTTEFFTIVKIGDQMISVDGNHPFAGKDLTVELTLLGIET